MFEHKPAKVEFSLHPNLKEQSGKTLCNGSTMSSGQPVAYCDLVQDRISRGEMRGEESELIWPGSYLFPSYDRDQWVYIRNFFFFFWNVSTFSILVDDAKRKVKGISSHHRLLEVRTCRVSHVLGEIYIELQDDLRHEGR